MSWQPGPHRETLSGKTKQNRELLTLQLPSPEDWDHGHAPPCLFSDVWQAEPDLWLYVTPSTQSPLSGILELRADEPCPQEYHIPSRLQKPVVPGKPRLGPSPAPIGPLRGRTGGEKQRSNRVQAGNERTLPGWNVGCGKAFHHLTPSPAPLQLPSKPVLGEKRHWVLKVS